MSKANSPTKPRQMRAAQREADAVQLRTEGMTFDRIGKELGITPAGAHRAVMRRLTRLSEIRPTDELARQLEVERLDNEIARQQHVIGEAGAAWERSKGERRKTELHVDPTSSNGNSGTPKSVKTVTEESCGDPRFLLVIQKGSEIIAKLVELRAKMLGLYNEREGEQTTNVFNILGIAGSRTFTPTELAQSARELAEHYERQGPSVASDDGPRALLGSNPIEDLADAARGIRRVLRPVDCAAG